ncbi:MAG: D-aminoacyl-tRNA deacylase [Spirochaetes bacterium]|nr:D-tyrosyl-tRNA(Tyr) deacylase [Acidobacteriota bacterium]MCX7039934.1 D-aminoacyl-tRNA deacylase [Spirochaetota bacterium]
MRAVVQRVRDCGVRVGERTTGSISRGLLVYLGIGRNDAEKDVKAISEKILALRIFPDENGKMNLSVRETGGGLMVVSQFTLYGDVRDGRRPSYTAAAEPARARSLYEAALAELRASGIEVASGEFAASMEVSYTNLGPVTILIDTEKTF